jgi:hypothetical protein
MLKLSFGYDHPMIWSVNDDGYFRNTYCALNKYIRFLHFDVSFYRKLCKQYSSKLFSSTPGPHQQVTHCHHFSSSVHFSRFSFHNCPTIHLYILMFHFIENYANSILASFPSKSLVHKENYEFKTFFHMSCDADHLEFSI